jgi:hypothetical protein
MGNIILGIVFIACMVIIIIDKSKSSKRIKLLKKDRERLIGQVENLFNRVDWNKQKDVKKSTFSEVNLKDWDVSKVKSFNEIAKEFNQ